MTFTEYIIHDITGSSFEFWANIIFLVILGILIGIFIMLLSSKTYRQGQIDAMNGKIKYRLTQNEDMEIYWEEIPRLKKGRKNENA